MNYQEQFGTGDAQMVVGELTGFRWWRVLGGGVLSGSYGHDWLSSEMKAKCDLSNTISVRSEALAKEFADKYGGEVETSGSMHVNANGYGFFGVDNTWCVRFDSPHRDRAPRPGCTCGIYAGYTPEDVRGSKPDSDFHILGVIKASGIIIPGNSGFKTQRARIVALGEILASDSVKYYTNINSGISYTAMRYQFTKPLSGRRYTMSRIISSNEPYHFMQDAEMQPIQTIDMTNKIREREGYRGVQFFDSNDEMLSEFPPDDLSALGINQGRDN